MRGTIGLMCHDSWGGSARTAMELGEQLAVNGCSVHTFTLSPPKSVRIGAKSYTSHSVYSWEQMGRHPAVLYREWTDEHYEAFFEILQHEIKKHQIELLHYHYVVPFAKIAADIRESDKFPDLRIVGTLHGTDVTKPPRSTVYADGLRNSLMRADILTTVSINHANLSKEVFKLDAPPVVIPDFVNSSRYEPGKRQKSVKADHLKRPRIVHISNFRAVKRPDQAVEIFSGIRATLDSELWFVGDGPMRAEVEALAEDFRLEDDIRFLGLTHEVPEILADSDLVLVTSREESFCLAALEGMMMGVPVLAPELGGLPELITHGESGLLYPPDAPAAAIKEAVEILTNPEKWHRIGTEAVKKVSSFSREIVTAKYETLYRDLLRDCPASAQLARPSKGRM